MSGPGGEGDGLAAGFAVGAKIADYRIQGQLGQGGMAVVFRAHDERLGRTVALKVLAPAQTAGNGFRSRFIRESRAAAAVDDPHIIPVFEAGEADGVLFIAMRYVSGGDVGALIRRDGRVRAERALAIISPVASALDAAHTAGLVHRDVKPANMLLDARPGRPDHVYLSDFGISKSARSSGTRTATGQWLGTLPYIAPEQVAGQAVDGRADQYALACTVFELLSGKPPFLRDDDMALLYAHSVELPPALTSRRPDLPVAVDAVLRKALAKDPADRYSACSDFAEALRSALALPSYSGDPGMSRDEHPATAAGIPAVTAPFTEPSPSPTVTASRPPNIPAHLMAKVPRAQKAPGLKSGAQPDRQAAVRTIKGRGEKREVTPRKNEDPGRLNRGPVSMAPRALGRPRRLTVRPVPLPRVTPGDIVIICWYPRESGIYILYQDNTIALLALNGEMPDVSPNGDWVSYVMNGLEIWLVRPNGSERRLLAKLADRGFTVSAAPRWSPDGTCLAFELRENKRSGSSVSNIYLLEVSTGQFKGLTDDLWVHNDAHGPVTWTANGHMVLLSGDKQLCLLRDTECTRLYESPGPITTTSNVVPWVPGRSLRDPVCSPNGCIIFVEFDSVNSASVGCLTLRPFSRGRDRMARYIDLAFFGSDIRSPRILSDNDTIVYASANSIYRASLDRRLASSVSRVVQRIRLPDYQDPILICESASDPIPIFREWKAELSSAWRSATGVWHTGSARSAWLIAGCRSSWAARDGGSVRAR